MDKIKQAVTPSIIETVSYLMISTALLSVTNFTKFIEYFQKSTGGVENIQSVDKSVQLFIDKIVGDRFAVLSTALFWMVIGIIAYVSIWAVISYFQTLKSEISFVQAFVHPLGYDRQQSMSSVWIKAAWRVVFGIIFLVWLFILLRYILPASSLAFYVGVINFPGLAQLAGGLFGVLFFALSMFAAVVLLRFTWLRTRLHEHWQ
jgi:hypothetical protein